MFYKTGTLHLSKSVRMEHFFYSYDRKPARSQYKWKKYFGTTSPALGHNMFTGKTNSEFSQIF